MARRVAGRGAKRAGWSAKAEERFIETLAESANVTLSAAQDAVRAYLAGRSVPNGAIATSALGESQPLVQTADGVREPQYRRVEITLGPGSGR